ncbi:hypothetical protein SAMN05660816_03890 [Niastella yeongjuensis]|nr:hypothetical protein SAMN05660816_03890 [Niastella yeongjuensis]
MVVNSTVSYLHHVGNERAADIYQVNTEILLLNGIRYRKTKKGP